MFINIYCKDFNIPKILKNLNKSRLVECYSLMVPSMDINFIGYTSVIFKNKDYTCYPWKEN